MKVLVVTGRLAERQVRASLRTAPRGMMVDVLVLPIPVAAMISPDVLEKRLPQAKARSYDVVLVPGMVPGSFERLSEKLGIEVWKGPRRASDLPLVLEALAEGVRLSPDTPADEILRDRVWRKIRTLLVEAEKSCSPGARVSELCIPRRPPPIRVLAELPPSLPLEAVEAEARRLARSGADVVVVGLGSEHGEGEARERVRLARRAGVPVGVDSNSDEAVKAAVEEGAAIVFSLNVERAGSLSDYADRAAFVVIPWREGVPRDPGMRLALLSETIRTAEKLGYNNLLVDPVLFPPAHGLAESIPLYVEASKRFPDHPLLAGLSNVTELVDMDSPGVNGVMTALLAEAGVSALLVTEESWKARGSVAETRIAAAMASAALLLGSTPKDLGIDLLVLKEKRPRGQSVEFKAGRVVEEPRRLEEHTLDPAGYVRIQVRDGLVEACFFKYGDQDPRLCVRGTHGLTVARVLVREAGIRDPSHIAYLGYELAKAEIAARLGRSYVQEEDLFHPPSERLRLLP